VPAIGRALLLKDRAYELLREAIVRLDLRPGHPLTEREVSGWLGVSKSPIRDALIRLEQEGLVASTPFKGFEVSPLTESLLRSVFEFREALELYCVEAFARQAPESGLAELQATHDEQRRLIEAEEWRGAYERSRFHRILAASLDNPLFDQAARVMHAQLRRIQNVASMIPGRIRRTHAEHDRVLAALRTRDVGTARAAMRAHIRSVLDDTLGSDELRRLSSGGAGLGGAVPPTPPTA
jgi:DNA-binding GntR family transcriptional regulator